MSMVDVENGGINLCGSERSAPRSGTWCITFRSPLPYSTCKAELDSFVRSLESRYHSRLELIAIEIQSGLTESGLIEIQSGSVSRPFMCSSLPGCSRDVTAGF